MRVHVWGVGTLAGAEDKTQLGALSGGWGPGMALPQRPLGQRYSEGGVGYGAGRGLPGLGQELGGFGPALGVAASAG